MDMPNKKNILLVEDEKNLQDALKLNLEIEGYDVTTADDGQKAIEILKNAYFDIMILDVMLPEVDGIQVCEYAKLNYADLPILILSAKANSEDRILGLKTGADDYLTKPFNLEELLLRINKLIETNNRIKQKNNELYSYTFGNYTINFEYQIAKHQNGSEIQLTKKENLLLKLLIENEDKVITRERILQTVWGYQVFPNTRTIDNFMLNFRKYFEEDTKNPKYFHSIRGMGYKFTSGK